jgi:hypothetical protein
MASRLAQASKYEPINLATISLSVFIDLHQVKKLCRSSLIRSTRFGSIFQMKILRQQIYVRLIG